MSEATTPAQPGQSGTAPSLVEKDGSKTPLDKTQGPASTPATKKLELTEEELEQQVQARLAAEKKKADEAEAAQEAEKKAARDKEKGEFKSLYETEQGKTKTLEAENGSLKLQLRQRDADAMLRDHVAAEARDYLPAVKYMAPLLKVASDTKDEDIKKQVKEIVAGYVKDNPRGTGTLPQKPSLTTATRNGGEANGSENPFLSRLSGM